MRPTGQFETREANSAKLCREQAGALGATGPPDFRTARLLKSTPSTDGK